MSWSLRTKFGTAWISFWSLEPIAPKKKLFFFVSPVDKFNCSNHVSMYATKRTKGVWGRIRAFLRVSRGFLANQSHRDRSLCKHVCSVKQPFDVVVVAVPKALGREWNRLEKFIWTMLFQRLVFDGGWKWHCSSFGTEMKHIEWLLKGKRPFWTPDAQVPSSSHRSTIWTWRVKIWSKTVPIVTRKKGRTGSLTRRIVIRNM